MTTNVSEGKECMSYSEMKGLLNGLRKEYVTECENIPRKKPAPPNNNRKRKLAMAPEVVLIRENKRRKREQRKLENPDVKPRKSRAQHTAESAETKAKRQICFRLYPGPTLEPILKEWLDITDDIFNHVFDVYEDHLAR